VTGHHLFRGDPSIDISNRDDKCAIVNVAVTGMHTTFILLNPAHSWPYVQEDESKSIEFAGIPGQCKHLCYYAIQITALSS